MPSRMPASRRNESNYLHMTLCYLLALFPSYKDIHYFSEWSHEDRKHYKHNKTYPLMHDSSGSSYR